jgi:hypothetical protein
VAASLPSTGAPRAYTPRLAKRPWIQASTSSSAAEDSEAEDSDSEAEDSEAEDSDANATDTRIASPDDEVAALAPTDAVAVACSLPSTGALRARIPRSAKRHGFRHLLVVPLQKTQKQKTRMQKTRMQTRPIHVFLVARKRHGFRHLLVFPLQKTQMQKTQMQTRPIHSLLRPMIR